MCRVERRGPGVSPVLTPALTERGSGIAGKVPCVVLYSREDVQGRTVYKGRGVCPEEPT